MYLRAWSDVIGFSLDYEYDVRIIALRDLTNFIIPTVKGEANVAPDKGPVVRFV